MELARSLGFSELAESLNLLKARSGSRSREDEDRGQIYPLCATDLTNLPTSELVNLSTQGK